MAVPTQNFFVDAPFAAMASPESARCWAARRDVLAELLRLCRRYTSRPDSALDVMWANLGAGKTHALFHMMYLLAEASPNDRAVYVELPEQPKSFLELFRRIALQLVSGTLLESSSGITGTPVALDVIKALRAYRHGDAVQRDVASEWLSGGRPQLRELKGLIGIGTRIEDDSRARDVLSAILQLYASKGNRVIILIDEFQRINSSRAAVRDAILANLRSVFSSNPTYFSVILAATSLVEQSAVDLLSPELRTLAGPRPAISLPEMSPEEAQQFLIERLACFRPGGYTGGASDPFGDLGLESIVKVIAQNGTQRLIPRTLLQLSGLVYDEVVYRGVTSASPELVLHVIRDELGSL